jgi:hypothetical protein
MCVVFRTEIGVLRMTLGCRSDMGNYFGWRAISPGHVGNIQVTKPTHRRQVYLYNISTIASTEFHFLLHVKHSLIDCKDKRV